MMQFTTPEQSKELLKLGIPTDSADCYYSCVDYKNIYILNSEEINGNLLKRDGFIPCWSVGRLIELFEICTKVKFKRNANHYPNNETVSLLEDIIQQIKYTISNGTMDLSELSK